uniref:Uncharacterized protein LOC111124159 n=1 Tax=Crassostrea virginica TaxID=6565 RepID=A0A8B8D5C3_CRAVI|nr:uncharacterized protein LOC111124159 [Crassostrea virginica]
MLVQSLYYCYIILWALQHVQFLGVGGHDGVLRHQWISHKPERKIICEFVGETDKRVQQWFKRRRKADQKRGKEVMRGDPSGLLSELKKVRSTFQLLPTSKALEEEGPKGNNSTEKTLHGEPQEDKKMIPVTKKEPGPTPFVWPIHVIYLCSLVSRPWNVFLRFSCAEVDDTDNPYEDTNQGSQEKPVHSRAA